MARFRVRPVDGKDPVLSAQPHDTDTDQLHWAELARADGWDVASLCHCDQPDLQALVGGNGYYAVNMCASCRCKVIVPPTTGHDPGG